MILHMIFNLIFTIRIPICVYKNSEKRKMLAKAWNLTSLPKKREKICYQIKFHNNFLKVFGGYFLV